MEENHPSHFAIHGDNGGDISPTRAQIELGLTRGYSKYADMLRLLGTPIEAQKIATIGEPTYEQEKNEEAQRQR